LEFGEATGSPQCRAAICRCIAVNAAVLHTDAAGEPGNSASLRHERRIRLCRPGEQVMTRAGSYSRCVEHWGVRFLKGRSRFDFFPEQAVSIMIWKDVELCDRGLKDFASLTPLERDYFVIKDLDIYYEMESGFEDYLLSGGNTSQLMWLKDALQRIGDIMSAHIITSC
jgi:hypothetical protein